MQTIAIMTYIIINFEENVKNEIGRIMKEFDPLIKAKFENNSNISVFSIFNKHIERFSLFNLSEAEIGRSKCNFEKIINAKWKISSNGWLIINSFDDLYKFSMLLSESAEDNVL